MTVRGCAKKPLNIFCGFNNTSCILEIVNTDKVKYLLYISDFYLFISHLVKGAKASKFIHTSANPGSHWVTLQHPHLAGGAVMICDPCTPGNVVASNTDNGA